MRYPFLKTFFIVTFVVFLAAACSSNKEAKVTYSDRTPIAMNWPDHENEKASAGGSTSGGATQGAQGGAGQGAQKDSELGENEIVKGIEAGPITIDTVAFGQRHISKLDGKDWAAITVTSVEIVATHRDSPQAKSERFGLSNCVVVKGTVEALSDELVSMSNPLVYADGFAQHSSFCLDPVEIAGMPFGRHVTAGGSEGKSTDFFLIYTTYEDSIDFVSFGGAGHFSQSGGPLEVAVFQKSDAPQPAETGIELGQTYQRHGASRSVDMSVDAVGFAEDRSNFSQGERCLVLRGKIRANWALRSRVLSEQIPGAVFGASPKVELFDADGKWISSAQGSCSIDNELISSTRGQMLMAGTDRHWTRAIPLPESGFDTIRVDGALLDISSADIGNIEPFDVSLYEDKPSIEEAGVNVVWESVKFGEATPIAPYSLRNIAKGTAQPDWTVSVDGTSVMETLSPARPGWVCLAVYGNATLDAVDAESGEAPFPGVSIFQDGRLYAYTSDCKGGTEFEDRGYVHRSSIHGVAPGESVKWYYHTSAPSSQLDFVTVQDTLFSVEGGEMTLGEAKPAVEPVDSQVLKSLGEEFAIRHREGVLDETWIFSVDDVYDSGGCQVAVGTVELNSISPGYHSAWLPVMSMGTLEGNSYRKTREQDVFNLSCDDEQLIQDGYTQLWYIETVPGQKVKWYQFFADTLWVEDIRAIEVGHRTGSSAVVEIGKD